MAYRDFFRSHLMVVLGVFVVLPFAVLGGLQIADIASERVGAEVSPLEEARAVLYDAERFLPWGEEWLFYTTAGSSADTLHLSFVYPPGARVSLLSVPAVRVEQDGVPFVLVGDGRLAQFSSEHIEHATESTLEGARLRELVVTSVGSVSQEEVVWRDQKHRAFVIDRSDTERIVVHFSPEFQDVQRFLDGLSWK